MLQVFRDYGTEAFQTWDDFKYNQGLCTYSILLLVTFDLSHGHSQHLGKYRQFYYFKNYAYHVPGP